MRGERRPTGTYRGEGNAAPYRTGIAHHEQEEDGADDAADDVATDEGDDAPNAGEDDDEDEGRFDHELWYFYHNQEHDGGQDQTEDAGNGRGVEIRSPIDAAVLVAEYLLKGRRSVRRDDAADGTDVSPKEEGEEGIAASDLLLAALGEVAAGGGSGLDRGRGCAVIVRAGNRRALDNDRFRHGCCNTVTINSTQLNINCQLNSCLAGLARCVFAIGTMALTRRYIDVLECQKERPLASVFAGVTCPPHLS